MNFLLFTLEYPPFKGGVANYYDHLVRHWPEPDNIKVIHNNENKLINKWSFPKWLPAFRQIRKEIRKNNINHIIVGHILPLGTVACFVSKFKKVDYSVILHGMDFSYAMKKIRKKRITKKILFKAKYIICANTYTIELVKKYIPDIDENKIKVINPGINPPPQIKQEEIEEFKSKNNLTNKIIILSIGRLVKRKGFDKVIQAMPEILKYIPNVCYYIAGKGPDEDYLKTLAKNNNNIIFIGNISENDKWLWLATCDIFAMPARNIDGDFEGFGIVFLEANIMGKPVLAGDSGGQVDAVNNTYSGLLVDPENTEQIANSIIKICSEGEVGRKMGEFGKNRALNDFNWNKQINLIFNLLNK